jgi:sn1-specific diacylglycerol lipase
MPALVAFGRKWRIGSDDLVFPNLASLCVRLLWFCLFGYVLNSYDRDYRCDDEKLLRVYLCILTGIHIAMCLVEVATISISARGTMADPSPRKNISIALYVEAGVFVLKFTWDVIGVLWAFDPSIDCPDSHPILVLARSVLLWNLFTSIAMALYAFVRIAVCRLPCVGPRLTDTARHKRLGRDLSSASDHGLLALSSEELRKHRQRDRAWQWRMQWMCCCTGLGKNRRNVFAEIGTVMADSFTYFRGYVPSDVGAGIALMAMEQSAEKNVCTYVRMTNRVSPSGVTCVSKHKEFASAFAG